MDMRKLETSVPGIYTITHIASGKTYVGQSIHCTKRWQSHRWNLDKKKHRNRPLQHAWSLHGAEAFEFAIVAQPIDPADRLAIADMEVAVLRNYPDNYNLMEVGEPRLEASAETKAKLSAERKARWADPEYRARLSAAHKAKHADPEWAARRAAAISAGKKTPEAKARAVAHSTALWAEGGKLRDTQGDVMAANWSNEEYRAKQTASRKAAWADPEIRARRSAAIKAAHARKRLAKQAG